MIRILFMMSFLGEIAIVMISIETIRETNASTTETTAQDPEELGAMMTQTGENIRNELASQGLIMREHLTNILGFNEIQSQLSLGYQFSFAGNISEANSQARRADNALEDTILSTFRTGQELTSLSQNRSLILDNDTRQILMAVGNGLTNLGTQIREQRTSLIDMLG
jgi:hypothetical protein